MKRTLEELTSHPFDLLVIGGGIQGACVAWDAALRGLSVALIEQNDFGSATSANSLKFIHGGLRYLQDGRLGLVRRMALERKSWLRIAPHLVRPIPIVIPTLPKLSRSRLAFAAALRLNDWISFDRNRGLRPPQWIGNGRLLSRAEYQEQAGWIDPRATGGALWYDAQMVNSERLVLAFIAGAVSQGAVVANYVRATGLVGKGRVVGVTAVDQPGHESFDIRARLIVNCSGGWLDGCLEPAGGQNPYPPSLALNLITRRLPPQAAIGVISPAGQMLFIIPWRDVSLIGTWHRAIDGRIDSGLPGDELVQNCLDDINAAYPPAQLSRADVRRVQSGFLPARDQGEPVSLLRDGKIYDHGRDGIPNLLTVYTVKYTMARWLAQKVVDKALVKLGRAAGPCRTAHTPLPGGEMPDFTVFVEEAVRARPSDVGERTMRHLVATYGNCYPQVLACLREKREWANAITADSPVVGAEIIYGIRYEMAQTLRDVVLRRTELGAAGLPDEAALESCARLMAAELGWDKRRCQKEIELASEPLPPRQRVQDKAAPPLSPLMVGV